MSAAATAVAREREDGGRSAPLVAGLRPGALPAEVRPGAVRRKDDRGGFRGRAPAGVPAGASLRERRSSVTLASLLGKNLGERMDF